MLRTFKQKFMNKKMTYKMVMIYIIAILLPTSIMAIVFWQVNLKELERSYYESKVNVILSARENMTVNLNQISMLSGYMEQSDLILELLAEGSTEVSETLFIYISEMLPLEKVIRQNPYVKNVGVYGYRDYALNMEYGLGNIEQLGKDEEFLKSVKEQKGCWELGQEGDTFKLRYYSYIYASSYPYDRGIVMLEGDLEEFSDDFYQQLSSPFYYCLDDGGVLEYGEEGFLLYQLEPDILQDEEQQIYEMVLGAGFPKVKIPIQPMQVSVNQIRWIFFVMVVMILVFTSFYLLMSYFIANRLKAFAEHIRNTDAENLTTFDADVYQDELGLAVGAYNELVDRTNSLIHENLRVQLQKRESDYYALHAQIHPHFLYNILENIRMSAEAHGDSATADMLLALGKHMRYNLNMSSQPITLEEELASAKNYLQIHKMRNHKIKSEILTATEIDQVCCPRFLLQPLLENALHHGYSIERPLHIQVQIYDCEERPGYVCISIEDNGNGIPEEVLLPLQEKLIRKEVEKSSHVGLLNVNSRLSVFCGAKEGCISIESRLGEGTRVTCYLKRARS